MKIAIHIVIVSALNEGVMTRTNFKMLLNNEVFNKMVPISCSDSINH